MTPEQKRRLLTLLQVQQVQKRGVNTDAATGNPIAMRPPRADAPGLKENRAPDRFGDTIADMTSGPIAMTKAFASGLADQSKSPTREALPDWLQGPARSGTAFAGDAAMTGLGALGSAAAFGAGLVGEAFGGSPTMERKLAGDLMAGMEVSVPELAGVGGAIRAGGIAAKSAKKLASPTESQAAARAAGNLGVTPSLGMSGKTGSVIASGLEKAPFSSGIIAKDASRAVDELGQKLGEITQKIGAPGTSPEAGSVLQKGLGDFVDRFKARASELYGKVGEHIPGNTRMEINNTASAVNDAKAAFAENPKLAQKLGLNEWDAVIEEAGQSGLSWDAASAFRTSIGEALQTRTGELGDKSTAKLKSLYAALTKDMEAVVDASGKDAQSAWSRANTYYKAGATRIERHLDKTINAQSPERAFEAFEAMARSDRATSDINRFRSIRRSMKETEWNDVSASIVERMGRATPGRQTAEGDAFSPTTFLTKWNTLSTEAKSLLVPKGVRKELDDFAKVADRAKSAEAARNHSNAGSPVGIAALAIGSAADVGLTASALATLNLSSRFMTSERALRALNNYARGDARLLRNVARGDSIVAKEAATILRVSAADTAPAAHANTDQQPGVAAAR